MVRIDLKINLKEISMALINSVSKVKCVLSTGEYRMGQCMVVRLTPWITSMNIGHNSH